MGKKTSGGYYAVARGRTVGIFNSWAECEANVKGFPGAKFKKFPSSSDAEAFIREWTTNASTINSSKPASNFVPATKAPLTSKRKSDESKEVPAKKRLLDCDSSLSPQEKLNLIVERSKAKSNDKVRTIQLITSPVSKTKTETREMSCLPFLVDEDDFVNVYTDGACLSNGQKKAQAGVGVWFGDDHPLNISRPVDGIPTNNNAELQAARLAIELAVEAGFKKLKINTDSAFMIQCMTEWIHKWKSNDWKLSTGGDVKNRKELEKIDKVQQNIIIRWAKVPAHSGIHGNEQADRLASEGARQN